MRESSRKPASAAREFLHRLFPSEGLCRDSADPAGLNAARTRLHQIEIFRREHERHQFVLFHADAVFAGQRAANRDAVPHDFCACSHDPLELVAIAFVEENQRVKVAVSCMENIADLQIVFAANFLDAPQCFREARAGNHAVLHVVHRREAAQRAEGVLPALPQ